VRRGDSSSGHIAITSTITAALRLTESRTSPRKFISWELTSLVDTKFYKGRLTVVCMERCIYDLILGNDIYKHGSERYEVKQSQAGTERIVDMIFQNSKLRSGSPQLEAVSEKNIKPTIQNGGVIDMSRMQQKLMKKQNLRLKSFIQQQCRLGLRSKLKLQLLVKAHIKTKMWKH